MSSMSRDQWNGARYEAAAAEKGHYESWFLRANSATDGRAFWIRYTIFVPKGRPQDAVGEVWAVVFDAANVKIVAVKEAVPITSCSFARDRLDVTIGTARLDDASLKGRASSNKRTIAWDLRYEGGQDPLLLLPEALYKLPVPRAKALVGRPNASFTGTIEIDGSKLAVTGWIGSQNHNWGSRHTDRYAWGQVAGFDEAPDAFLECSTARLRIGPVWSPWMSPVVLRLGGETFAFNGLPRTIRAKGTYAPYHWRIETGEGDTSIDVRMSADVSDFVALRYPNPPGGTKICMNSKVARCEVQLRRRGETTVLHSSRAAFEILEDSAPQGVDPVV